ncbi:MAG TPA: acyl-CoA thioesterase [Gammaproteobacteria bacterium]|nr:acyl-CoA thioesterase [Gammaproteobacteria bacterium]
MPEQEKSLYMTVLMTPDMANFSGHVHGGQILKMLDQVAFACAARYCKNYVVTLSLDQVTFKAPINVGELVSFRAHVNYVGKTSLEVGVKVIAEDLHSKVKRHTNSGYFTMVAVDDNGKSIPVPPLKLESEFERKLYEAAVMRKEMRAEMVRRNKELTADIPDYNVDVTS